MNKEGERFELLRQTFPRIIEVKIREDIFVGPQVKQLFQDPNFKNKLNTVERRAWNVFRNVWSNFLGNKKIRKVHRIRGGATFLTPCLGVQHAVETPFPAILLGFFSQGNMGTVSDEHSERFHQDIS